jgi:DNA-binding protein YbaB
MLTGMAPSDPYDRQISEAQALRDRLSSFRDDYRSTEVAGTARGGAVVIRVTASGEFKQVRIDPEVYAGGPEEVEDAVLVALRDATDRLREEAQLRLRGLNNMFDSLSES